MAEKHDYVDDFLRIGGGFDWIGPAAAFVADLVIAGGKIGDFGVSGYTEPKCIKKIAKKRKIQVWGFMHDDDMTLLMFTVKKDDAQAMYDALRSAGCSPMYYPKHVDS